MISRKVGLAKARTLVGASLAIAAVLALFVGPAAVGAQNTEDDPALFDSGKAVYDTACAGCHGADGTGTASGRPLTGIAEQEPDRLVHIASVTDGKGGMPAYAEQLSAEEIDAAVTYVRLAFVQEAMDELPRTGANDWIIGIGLSLVVLGALIVRFEQQRSNLHPGLG